MRMLSGNVIVNVMQSDAMFWWATIFRTPALPQPRQPPLSYGGGVCDVCHQSDLGERSHTHGLRPHKTTVIANASAATSATTTTRTRTIARTTARTRVRTRIGDCEGQTRLQQSDDKNTIKTCHFAGKTTIFRPHTRDHTDTT